jgi:selenoprotein W-related protein
LEDELKNERADIELIAGSGGVFKVVADGKEIFSKKDSGRFPEPGEITALLHSL